VIAILVSLAYAPLAGAQIIGPQDPDEPEVDSPWQAGTCKMDPAPPGQCSVATPGLFYELAAGHPPVGFTQFIVNTETGPALGPAPIGNLRTVRVDLVASLRGQVDVDLVGRIDSVHGRIRTTYDTVPDVPVSAFVLTVRGGNRGLLTNSRDQCSSRKRRKARNQAAHLSRRGGHRGVRLLRAVARIAAQNGRKANQRPKVRRACGKAQRRRHRRHRRAGG
jgi:hypothetical protein